MESQKRGQWASNLGFILAAAGSAVGLGNIWKFPYLAGSNGGGAFVIVYLLMVVLVGFTIMLGEMAIGRNTKLSPVGAYSKINKHWGFVGMIGVIVAFLILSFYSVIGGWVLNYIFKYVTGGIRAAEASAYFSAFIADPYIPVLWHFGFMAATWFIVCKGIAGGIEKFSKFLMPALFVLLIIVALRSVTLPGAWAGIEFYMKPDFSKINASTVMAALGQAFFSLSLGMGAIITYGSYLGKNENLEKNAMIIPAIDTLAALLAGFAVIPAVFAFGMEVNAGPSLMFITLPAVFDSMPLGSIFGCAFFILVFFAAITSSISLLEVVVSYLIDNHKWNRMKSSLVVAAITFLIGIPCSLSQGPIMSEFLIMGMSFFDFTSFVSESVLMPLGGLLMCIFIGYVWGIPNAVKEITGNGSCKFKFVALWTVLIKYIAPVLIFFVWLNATGLINKITALF